MEEKITTNAKNDYTVIEMEKTLSLIVAGDILMEFQSSMFIRACAG